MRKFLQIFAGFRSFWRIWVPHGRLSSPTELPPPPNWVLDVRGVVLNPSVNSVWCLLHTILDGLETKFDQSFSEGAVQAVIEGVLRVLPPDKMDGVSVVCEENLDPPPGPPPRCWKCGIVCGTKVETKPPNLGRHKWQCPRCNWNKWHPRYRVDMSLRHENTVLLLEFKRLRPENVTGFFSGANEDLWRAKRCDAAADRALAGQGCKLNAAVCHYRTLKELEDSAQRQCRNYQSILTAKGLSVKAFTVVHWTQYEDCPSALLVQEVKGQLSAGGCVGPSPHLRA